MSNSYIYCFIRKDLSVAQQIIQLGHSVFEMGAEMECPNSPNFVLFEVDNEEELIMAFSKVVCKHIHCNMFQEPDRNNECTSFCTEIIDDNSAKRNVFRNFRLYT